MLGLRRLSGQLRVPPILSQVVVDSVPFPVFSHCIKFVYPAGVRFKSKGKEKTNVDHRFPSPCDVLMEPPHPKPCLNLQKITIERGNMCHEKMIRSFLYAHYWPREPSCTGLWMSLDSPLMAVLTDKYSTTGDRFLAFERQNRTGERKLIGIIIAYQAFPWYPDELEEWALHTVHKPERNRMYFMAHCFRSPNLFAKYHIPEIYDVEVLVTASEVGGLGVGKMLVKTVLDHSTELRHPLTQLVAKSKYASKICADLGMKKEWSMNYSDFIDNAGRSVFYPRKPHYTVSIYSKRFNYLEN